jgi:DNA/RNA endonuclease G (NUC1)
MDMAATKKEAPEAVEVQEQEKSIRDILEEEMPGPVTFTVPRNPQKPRYLLVSVNGVRYSMDQGKTVTVPWHVWKVVDDSMKADEAVAERIDRLTSNPYVQTIS